MNTKPIGAKSRRNRSRVLAGVALGVGLLLAGCGNSDDASETTSVGGADDAPEAVSLGFVGTVEGTDAFVAVMVADSDTEADEAVVYVCDGEAELREWFSGPIDDPTAFRLTNDAGASVTVEWTDEAFSGEFTEATGSVHGFDTVVANGDAGLYEVDDEAAAADGVWAAWVVDNEGNERGALLRGGTFQTTPRLSSTTFRLSRFSVTNGVIEMNGVIAPNN